MTVKLAVIGGTGVCQLPELAEVEILKLESRYSESAIEVKLGKLNGVSVCFLPRHGENHQVPPHKINYRANLDALKNLGVETIIAINAVGGIHAAATAGSLFLPDQIVDYSYGREHTFSDGISAELQHVDFTEPFTEGLRGSLLAAATEADIQIKLGGTVGVAQGPRLETAAEILRMKRDGCDLVGMTTMPEAGLARELGIAYATICMVVNPAAGKSQKIISMKEIQKVLDHCVPSVKEILKQFCRQFETQSAVK